MATNIAFKPGDHISLPVPAGTKSGDPVRVGSLNGVAVTDRAKVDVAPDASGYNWGGGNPTGNASVWLEGIVEVVVAVTASITVGQPICWDATDGLTDATDNGATPAAVALPVWGVAVAAVTKGSTDTELTVPVRITN